MPFRFESVSQVATSYLFSELYRIVYGLLLYLFDAYDVAAACLGYLVELSSWFFLILLFDFDGRILIRCSCSLKGIAGIWWSAVGVGVSSCQSFHFRAL